MFHMDVFHGYDEETTKNMFDDKQLKDICIANYNRNEHKSCLIYSGGH